MGVLKLEQLVRELSNSLSLCPGAATPEDVIARVSEMLDISPANITGGMESLNLVLARSLVIEGYMSSGENSNYEAIAATLQRPLSTVRTLHKELREWAEMPVYRENEELKHFPSIASLLQGCQRGTPPQTIINYVAKAYGVDPDEVRNGNRRRRHITPARHLAMYILRENLELSYRAVAECFDKGPVPSPTAVRLAIEKISLFLKEKRLDVKISVIEEELFSPKAEKTDLEQRFPDIERDGNHAQLVQNYLAWRLNAKVRDLLARSELKISDLIPEMARYTGLSVEKILTERKAPHSAIRAACCVVARERFNASYEFCGEQFGGKEHSTIWYYFEQLRNAGLIPEEIVHSSDAAAETEQAPATATGK